MSLQDHIVQIYLNISRKTKFIKTLKFLKYSVYRHLIICYTPPVNWKSIRQLEVEIWTFKVYSFNTIVKLNNMHITLLLE